MVKTKKPIEVLDDKTIFIDDWEELDHVFFGIYDVETNTFEFSIKIEENKLILIRHNNAHHFLIPDTDFAFFSSEELINILKSLGLKVVLNPKPIITTHDFYWLKFITEFEGINYIIRTNSSKNITIVWMDGKSTLMPCTFNLLSFLEIDRHYNPKYLSKGEIKIN